MDGVPIREKVFELIVPRKFLFTEHGFWNDTDVPIECNDRHAAGPPIDARRRGKTKDEKKKTMRQSAAIYSLRQFSSIARVRSRVRARDLSVCERRNNQFANESLIGLICRQSWYIISHTVHSKKFTLDWRKKRQRVFLVTSLLLHFN